MFFKRKKGQTSLEYVIVFIILMAVFLSISNYFKRGMQGRWKASVDDLGEQYDPQKTISETVQTIESNTITTIRAREDDKGHWTDRFDVTNSVDRKYGRIEVGE